MQRQHLTRRINLHVMLLQHMPRLGIPLTNSFHQRSEPLAEFAVVGAVVLEIRFFADPCAAPGGEAASHSDGGAGCLVGFEEVDWEFFVAAFVGAGDGVGAFVNFFFEFPFDGHGLEGEEGATVGTFGGIVWDVGGLGEVWRSVVYFLLQYSAEAGSAEARFAGGLAAAYGTIHVFKTNGTFKLFHVLPTRFSIIIIAAVVCISNVSPTTFITCLIWHGLRFQRG